MNTKTDQKYTIGFCGSGKYSVQCLQALADDDRFRVAWTVCPPAKPAGRGHQLKASELQMWSEKHEVPYFVVEKNLAALSEMLQQAPSIDFLVVVSFGYLILEWLLQLPRIAPVNVHPSALPLYRGSSPGQFAVLYGEIESSVSIMTMNAKFDEGAIITQLPFRLDQHETQTSYYERAFALAQQHLPETLAEYAQTHTATPQPQPTADAVLARRLTREDGFLPFSLWETAEKDGSAVAGAQAPSPESGELGPALQELLAHQPHLSVGQLVDRAVRAFTPWPGVWTLVPEYKGKRQVRLKILETELHTDGNIRPRTIQYEGEPIKTV